MSFFAYFMWCCCYLLFVFVFCLVDCFYIVLCFVLLFAFFCGFNILEASQPSMASRMAPPQVRGAALGVYNTLQSLGFFVGGAAGGWLVKNYGTQALFAACAAAMLLWLMVAWGMKPPLNPALQAP
jgi:predicted MFS family arabinose efflux permease